MRLESGPLDDAFQELQFVLDADGGRLARLVRTAHTAGYRLLKAAMLATLRLHWRCGGRS